MRRNKKFDLAQKVIWCQKNKLMLHKEVFNVNKKIDVAQSISSRQTQDDAAQKKFFARKSY